MDKGGSMAQPRLIVFASGSKIGGGSGFERLVEVEAENNLGAQIVAVVSNHENGGVRERADRLDVPFVHFKKPWTGERYQKIVQETKADFVALSGWLKLTRGLDPRVTINIHPGLLPRFGGKGMFGHYVHEAVMKAYHLGKVQVSAVSMHFVTEEYDQGPIILDYPIKIDPDDDANSLGARVNRFEHIYQPVVTKLVVTGQIKWDGVDPRSLKFPSWYNLHECRTLNAVEGMKIS